MIGPRPMHSRHRARSPDLTALVDVVFLILVFLLLSVHPLRLGLKVELPAKGAD